MTGGKVKTTVPKKKATSRQKKDWFAAYVFIAPVTIGLLVFYIWPFIQNVWFSFNDVNKFNVSTFVGLQNYIEMFQDKEVWRTFGNTLKYVIITVPVGLFLSICIAALMNSKIKGTSIYRTLYFLPSVTMAAAVSMVWKWIYNEKMGILNSAIRALGGEGHGWLTDPKTALYCIMIVGLWMTVGYNMIILLAGMQGISKSYYEAAAIDGATPTQTLFHVTIPMVMPSVTICSFLTLTNSFKLFDQNLALNGKSPDTSLLALDIYKTFYDHTGLQLASWHGIGQAKAVIFFLIVALIAFIQLRATSQKEVEH